MTINVPEHLEQYVHDQVQAGRFRSSEDDVILDALERHRQAQQQPAAPANRRDEPSSLEMQRRLLEDGKRRSLKEQVLDLLAQGAALTRAKLRDSLSVKNERLGAALDSLERAGRLGRTPGGWQRLG